jgi:hypothetical protein
MSNSNLKIIMKTKLIIICCALLFISCLEDEDRVRIGFTFEIVNLTNLEFENVKVTIGGLQNGEFVGTESYTLPSIWIRSSNSEVQNVAIDNNRWKPNLNLIKAISEQAYFTVQLEGESPILLYDSFENDVLISAKITENGIIKNKYGGALIINLYSNGDIRGQFFER